MNDVWLRKKTRGDVLLREHEVVDNLLDNSGMEEIIGISTFKGKASLTQQK